METFDKTMVDAHHTIAVCAADRAPWDRRNWTWTFTDNVLEDTWECTAEMHPQNGLAFSFLTKRRQIDL